MGLAQPPGAGTTAAGQDDVHQPESMASLLGGWRASADATLPPLAFVGGWLATGHSIPWGALTAIGVSVAVAGYRLAQGTRPRAVLIGLIGVCVAALIALYTGRAIDFFLPRLLTNAASALAWVASIVLRWPLLGVVVGALLRQRGRWRRDAALLRAYSRASWVWVLQYVVRTAVLGALYYLGWTEALAVAQVLLTWPLIVACIAASAWVMHRSMPAGHPGFRHPRGILDTHE